MDYYLIRRRVIDVQALFRVDGSRYYYRGGWNPLAVGAFLAGVLPCVPGFLHACLPHAFPHVNAFFRDLYDYAWFIALGLSAATYALCMQAAGLGRSVPAAEYARRA